MQNDIFIKHVRLLALLAANSNVPAVKDAVSFISREIGLEGPVVAASQVADRDQEKPDTLLNADIEGVSHETRKLGDITYLPNQRVMAVSSNIINGWRETASRMGLTYSFRDKDRDMHAFNEDMVLDWAKRIKAYRKMDNEAVENLRRGKELDGESRHDGTDAEKQEKSAHHPYENWNGVEKSRSSICLTIASGSRYLNGSMALHTNHVSIEIHTPDGRQLCRASMSPEQFAAMLIGRTSVPCTLDRYPSVNEDTITLRERVYEPESLIDRMKQRLQGTLASGDDRLKKIIESLEGREGKPLGKRDQDALLHELKIALEHRLSNTAFVVEQGMEEGSKLAETATLRVLLAQAAGLNNSETAKALATSFGQLRLTGGSQQ